MGVDEPLQTQAPANCPSTHLCTPSCVLHSPCFCQNYLAGSASTTLRLFLTSASSVFSLTSTQTVKVGQLPSIICFLNLFNLYVQFQGFQEMQLHQLKLLSSGFEDLVPHYWLSESEHTML